MAGFVFPNCSFALNLKLRAKICFRRLLVQDHQIPRYQSQLHRFYYNLIGAKLLLYTLQQKLRLGIMKLWQEQSNQH